jgi:ATP-binding cassette subfamily C protein CydC
LGPASVRLSGGQARRVASARALMKMAPLRILAEPTDGVDPETARQIMANIVDRATARQQTLLLLTHRLQGLERMDEIAVMAEGRTVESGTQEALRDFRGHDHRLCAGIW